MRGMGGTQGDEWVMADVGNYDSSGSGGCPGARGRTGYRYPEAPHVGRARVLARYGSLTKPILQRSKKTKNKLFIPVSKDQTLSWSRADYRRG